MWMHPPTTRTRGAAAGAGSPARPPRYANIQPLVRNGASVLHAAAPTRGAVVSRLGEPFSRTSPQQLAAALAALQLAGPPPLAPPTPLGWRAGGDPRVLATVDAAEEAHSAAGGCGGGPGPALLLLDVRPAGEHATARVRGSLCCDPVLARQDKWPPQLVLARTRPDVGVVAYGLRGGGGGEAEAAGVAARLAALGWAHVAVLSGGLEGVAAAAPGLVDGPEGAALVGAVAAAGADPTRPPLHVLKRRAAAAAAADEGAGAGGGGAGGSAGQVSSRSAWSPGRAADSCSVSGSCGELRGFSQLVGAPWAAPPSQLPLRAGGGGGAVFRGTGTEREGGGAAAARPRSSAASTTTTSRGGSSAAGGFSFGGAARFGRQRQ